MCEPRNRPGRTTLRITTAVHDAREHEQDEDVRERHEPAWRPSHGSSLPVHR